jgi:voltage-gated potassium channel
MPTASTVPKWLFSSERRFLYLLIFLMILIFMGPFISSEDRGFTLYDALYTGVLIMGAYSASGKKSSLVIALSIFVPAVALIWLDHFDPSSSYALPRRILAIMFFTYIGGTILFHVLKAERVTFDKICAALCSYLLLGLIFAILYSLLEFLNPGMFLAGGEVIRQGDPRAFQGAGFGQAIYFSFTTLTTLGYGDLTGATPIAKNLSVLEAIIGQIYLVVLVARLVGLEISHSSKQDPS